MTDGNDFVFVHDTRPQGGSVPLTKREYYTGLAMQGQLANSYYAKQSDLTPGRIAGIAQISVKLADAIIKELNNEPNY